MSLRHLPVQGLPLNMVDLGHGRAWKGPCVNCKKGSPNTNLDVQLSLTSL